MSQDDETHISCTIGGRPVGVRISPVIRGGRPLRATIDGRSTDVYRAEWSIDGRPGESLIVRRDPEDVAPNWERVDFEMDEENHESWLPAGPLDEAASTEAQAPDATAEQATLPHPEDRDEIVVRRPIGGREVEVRFVRLVEGDERVTMLLDGQTLPIYRASWTIKGRPFEALMVMPIVKGKEVWERVTRLEIAGRAVWARVADFESGGGTLRLPIDGHPVDVRIARWADAEGKEVAHGVIKRVVDGRERWDLLEPMTTAEGRELWVRPAPLVVDDRPVRLFADGQEFDVQIARWTIGGAEHEAALIRRDFHGQKVWERLTRLTVDGKDAWCRTVKLTIDGKAIEVPEQKVFYDSGAKTEVLRPTTIYDAAAIQDGDPRMVTMFETRIDLDEIASASASASASGSGTARIKADIPVLCHRDHLNPVAVCRVCVVDLNNGGKLVPSCQRQVENGLNVSTYRSSRRVAQSVKTLLGLLMADHPSPCEKQKADGDCELEALAHKFGAEAPPFPSRAEERPRDDSSVVIKVDHNACILCDRCIRACNDVRENHVLGRMNKGYASRIAFDLDEPMGNSSCVACGECMVSCPTGALTRRTAAASDPWEEIRPRPEVVAEEELFKHPIREIRRAFRGVSHPFLRYNRGSIVRRRFKKGEVICREGEFGSTAFLIERGSVQIEITSPRKHVRNRGAGGLFGRLTSLLVSRGEDSRDEESTRGYITIDAPVALPYNQPVASLREGDIFGEMSCMNFYPRSATVRAAEDVVVLEMLRNVLYIMQRSATYRDQLEETYKRRAIASHLRSVELFAPIRRDEEAFGAFVDSLRDQVQLKRFGPGQVIFRQGAAAEDGFYLVRTGFVKVAQKRIGGEHVLNYVGPGGYFGEIGLMANVPEVRALASPGVRTATCSALDHVDVVQVTAERFRAILAQFPPIAEALTKIAVERLRENAEAAVGLENQALGEFLRQGLMNAQSLLVLDLEKCTRCDECTKACADAHDGVTRLIREGLRFDKFLVASSCRSCLDPYCMVGCPVGSIRRRSSREIIIEDWCIGCGKCAENCPYGNINMHPFPQLDEKGRRVLGDDPENPGRKIPVVQQKATMCDLCTELDGVPSCVYACPHDAAHRMSGRDLWGLVQIGAPPG